MDFKGPAVREIKKFVKEKSILEFVLTNNKSIKGIILWVDENVFHLQLENGNSITLMKSAILYYQKIK